VKCLRAFSEVLGDAGVDIAGDEAEKAALAVLQAG
jgi:hypothetical protein